MLEGWMPEGNFRCLIKVGPGTDKNMGAILKDGLRLFKEEYERILQGEKRSDDVRLLLERAQSFVERQMPTNANAFSKISGSRKKCLNA